MTCGPTAPASGGATNVLPMPIRDPIATTSDDEDDAPVQAAPASATASAVATANGNGKHRHAKAGQHQDQNAAKLKKAAGRVSKKKPGKKKAKDAKITQPWIRWLTQLSNQVQSLLAGADPYGNPTPGPGNDNDMWDIGFWANADDAGAAGAVAGDGETDHPGIINLTTGAVANNTAGTWSAGAAGYVRLDQISLGRYVFKTPPTITTCRFEAGMTSNPQSGWTPFVFEAGTDMFYLFFDTNVDTALRVKVRAGGATTVSEVVINPCPADTWVDFLVQRRLTGSTSVVDLIINGTPRHTVSGAELPADSTLFGSTFKVSNRVAADRTMKLDFGRIKPTVIPKRYTVSLT